MPGREPKTGQVPRLFRSSARIRSYFLIWQMLGRDSLHRVQALMRCPASRGAHKDVTCSSQTPETVRCSGLPARRLLSASSLCDVCTPYFTDLPKNKNNNEESGRVRTTTTSNAEECRNRGGDL